MASDPVERLNYYQYQYVGAEDFRDQQAYHRDMRRRHNLGPHLWGIVSGLGLAEQARENEADFVDVYVRPGVAVDGFGREIVILEPVKLDPGLFLAYGDTSNGGPHSTYILDLWIRYDELGARTATGGFAPCTDAEAYSRVAETYKFLIGVPQEWTPLMVGGMEAKIEDLAAPGNPIRPRDGSIPYQDFPDDERQARWPVRLGTLYWDGTARKFLKAPSPAALAAGREYAGLVGGALLSEGPSLRLAPRVAPATYDAADFANVEGRLRVWGRIDATADVMVNGGRVDWRQGDGGENARPLWMSRLTHGGGADLRIHIGKDGTSAARLTIGPGPAPTALASEKIVLAVRCDDRIDIPTGRLRFNGTGPRALIDLSLDNAEKALSNIGRHATSLYYRSAGEHYWYAGGDHNDADGNPGGGTPLLRLSALGALHFLNGYKQVVNLAHNGQSFGIGAQDFTLYFRSAANFAWYRGGSPASGQLDPGGGDVAMWLDGASRLTVDGGITSNDSIRIHGAALDFRTATGSADTDVLEIRRVRNGADRNDLQVTIGDNIDGQDRFVVGPRYVGDGLFYEQFAVENNGDVRVARDLYVGGRKALIDVVAGEIVINQEGGSAGVPLIIPSKALARISEAEVIVALSDIGNKHEAIDARWRVKVTNKIILPPNMVSFWLNWDIGDSDGQLFSFSYIVVFRP